MSDDSTPNSPQPLDEVLLKYVEAAEAGNPPDHEQFIAEHPKFADEIADFLANYNQLNDMATPLRGARPRAVRFETLPKVLRGKEADAHLRSTEAPGGPREFQSTPELGQLGDYQLIREIGRGGMGVVYEAEQISLRRRVALKILPFAGGVDSRQLQRFRNEAQAAAHLHHSHIVPVFAVGSERGVHFYAMQFIEGQSLATLIENLVAGATKDELRAQPGPSASTGKTLAQTLNSMSLDRSSRPNRFFKIAATLGKNVAEALEYAHQMGIVHRDVKPANLLLDGRGHVWIADFGLAQFQTQAGLTISGEVLGTLRYVSPEQAMAKRGVVDHRTDIYSLGATLYELLTLKPVFDGKDRHALLHQIAFDEPIAPRIADPTIPIELETIVLKALAKNPGERYATAQELADDLQRFLEDQPILAKRPGVVERARKWGRRHPSAVVATLLLLFFGVVGFAASTVVISREQWKTQEAYDKLAKEEKQTKQAYERLAIEEKRTKGAYEAEAKQRNRAEQDFAQAQRAIELVIQFSEGELAHYPDQQDVRRRLLMTLLDYYEDFLIEHADDAAAQAELTAGRERVALILTELSSLRGTSLVGILQNADVQKDLDLDADQKKRIEQFVVAQIKQPREMKFGPKDKGPRPFDRPFESAAAVEKILADTLRVTQKQRFDRIVLQVQQQGRYGFSDPKLVQTLSLTSQQRDRIRKIQNEAHQRWAEHLFSEKKIEDPKIFWSDIDDRILVILDPSQREFWSEMIGPRITVDLREGYPWDGRNVTLPRMGPFFSYQSPPPPGAIAILHDRGDFTGSGFGHKIKADDKQYFAWQGKEIPPTVFEIAVTSEPLSADERRLLPNKAGDFGSGKVGEISKGWKVLFNSDDPSIWNTVSPDPGRYAVPLSQVDRNIRYLRLKRQDTGEMMLIPMTYEGLAKANPVGGNQPLIWNGSASEMFGGRHLGIAENRGGRAGQRFMPPPK